MSTHVAQRRLADFAALAVAVDVQHLLHGLAASGARTISRSCSCENGTQAQSTVLRFFLEIRRDGSQQLLRTGRAQLPQPVEARVRSFSCAMRADAVLVDRLDDVALA